jgi:hypothetical protein
MTSRTRSSGLEFQVVTMSPTSSPARAAGPSGSMLATRIRRRPRVGWTSKPHRLQAGAKISSKNMALRQQLIDDTVDGRRRNGEHATTRSEDGHADYASLHVDDGAPLRGRAECQIKTDKTVDGSATKTVPSRSRDGDDAEASDWRTFVIPDCQDDVTRAQRRRIGGRRRRQSVRLKAQHGDVSAGIPPRERGRDYATSWKRNLDVLVPLQNFFSSDDDSGTPMDAA